MWVGGVKAGTGGNLPDEEGREGKPVCASALRAPTLNVPSNSRSRLLAATWAAQEDGRESQSGRPGRCGGGVGTAALRTPRRGGGAT